MQPENYSRDAASYYWNFCSGNLLYMPEGEKISGIPNMESPAFIEIVQDGSNYFAFVTNHLTGTITRLEFGSSLLNNNPTAHNIGNPENSLPTHLEGIQIRKEGDKWYGIAVGGIGIMSRIVRLEFGSSLTNMPSGINMGNIGDLDYPIDLFLFQDNSSWYAYTVNFTSNTITRFSFGPSLQNTPTGENIGNIGNLNEPSGIFPVLEGGTWHMFVNNFGSNTISHLIFGNSILNNPSGSNIGGNEVLKNPRDITLIKDCERTFGFVVNHYNSTLTRLIFEGGLESQPTFEDLGNIGQMYQPHGLSKVFRVGNDLYLFTANVGDNTLTRFHFPSCNNAIPAYSNERTPGKVTYNQPGEYNVILILDEGLPTSEILCKNLIAVNNPVFTLGNDTSIFPGTTITLSPNQDFEAYNWSTNETSQTINVGQSGTYWLEVTDTNGCKNNDQIEVTMAFFIPEFFTPNGDGINDNWALEYFRNKTGYQINVYDRYGKLLTDEGQDWDGKYNGIDLPADTYWYIITFDDGTKPVKGNVSIVR